MTNFRLKYYHQKGASQNSKQANPFILAGAYSSTGRLQFLGVIKTLLYFLFGGWQD
jgi:hypothetical protein